jgi:hypothetical protein
MKTANEMIEQAVAISEQMNVGYDRSALEQIINANEIPEATQIEGGNGKSARWENGGISIYDGCDLQTDGTYGGGKLVQRRDDDEARAIALIKYAVKQAQMGSSYSVGM